MKNELERIIFKELRCSNVRDGEADVDLQVVNGTAIIHQLHIQQIAEAIIKAGYVKKSELGIDESQIRTEVQTWLKRLLSEGDYIIDIDYYDINRLVNAISQSSSSLIVEKGEK